MKDSVKLFFAGDFCSKPSTSSIKVSDELKALIASCDLKFVNFEVPLKPEGVHLPPQKRERFFQNDDAPAFLKGLGFNLFSLANNHVFDWGEEGFKKTKAALGDEAFGAGTYDEAYTIKVVDVKGTKIGFMALCFSAYTGVFDDSTNHDGLGCAFINDLIVNHVILQAKTFVDYLFILPHNGIEYIDVPLPETIARYRDFIDYGADGVIGSHPHCPQGWEIYKGKPIFYSLGNFLFNSKEGYDYRATNRPHWYEGLCVVISIEDDGLKWRPVYTRNVDNTGIVLEETEQRKQAGERLCTLLQNKDEYWRYFRTVCEKIGYNNLLNTIDKTIHPRNMMSCLKRIALCLIGKNTADDHALARLLRHDSHRELLLWSLKLHNKNGL